MKTKMKWALIYLILIIVIINGMLIVLINAQTYPTIKPFVNDFANVLSPEEENLLENHCAKLDMDTSYQIVIVTLNSTNGADALDYANHIGENNGVGQKETDNGVVILWVTEDNKGAIAVGRGAETYLNDAKVGEIGRSSRNQFDNKKYYQGFEQIVSDIEKTIKKRDTSINNASSSPIPIQSKKDNGLLTTIIVIFIIGLLIYLILSKAGVVPRPNFRFRSGGGSGFGGRSFGGGSFGGGGSRF
jgi:uncharacterized protein